MRTFFATAALALALAAPAGAESFQTIQDERAFKDLVLGKYLTRLGIRLEVTGAGEIQGRAFGKPVTGNWRWRNGAFCRDLYHGGNDLGPNCQMVKARGNTVRFISDRGAGIYADFVMR